MGQSVVTTYPRYDKIIRMSTTVATINFRQIYHKCMQQVLTISKQSTIFQSRGTTCNTSTSTHMHRSSIYIFSYFAKILLCHFSMGMHHLNYPIRKMTQGRGIYNQKPSLSCYDGSLSHLLSFLNFFSPLFVHFKKIVEYSTSLNFLLNSSPSIEGLHIKKKNLCIFSIAFSFSTILFSHY